jgi:hypothetical protein
MNASQLRPDAGSASSPARAVLLAFEADAIRFPWRFALLAVLALLAATLLLLTIGYETNDDVFLTMIVSGRGFCPRPDEHLIFSNVLLGHALKWLYECQPNFPWYGGYLLLTHYLAQVAILYCALTINRCSAPAAEAGAPTDAERSSFRRRISAYAICFLVSEIVLLNNLQYTSSAFLAAQAGIFLLYLAATRGRVSPIAAPPWRSRRWKRHITSLERLAPLIPAALFLILAGLIRLESLAMTLLVAAPLFACAVFTPPARAIILPAVTAAVVGVVLVAAAKYDADYYAADPTWRHFHAFNTLRVKFNDYAWTTHTPETAPIFSAVGWTKNDHDMIARYYFDDANLYSESRLSAVLNAHPWKTARLTWRYPIEFCRRVMRDRAAWALMLSLPFLYAGLGGSRLARRTVLACCLTAFILIAIISINNKVPPVRVYFPLLSFPLYAALLFPIASTSLPLKSDAPLGFRHWFRNWWMQPRWTRAVATMLVVGMVMTTVKQTSRSAKNQSGRSTVERFVAQANSQPQKLYVCWEAAFPFEFISPLDNLADWTNLTTYTLAWMQRTPWLDEIKARFAIPDLAAALYERDDLVLIATNEHRSLFETFAKEHYGADVEFIPGQQGGKRFVAGRFQHRPTIEETAARPAPASQR